MNFTFKPPKSEKVINEVLELIGEKRELLNNILRRKPNWVSHIVRRNCLLHDAIEGYMMEVKGVGRSRTQLLDDLRDTRRNRKLNIEKETTVHRTIIRDLLSC